MKSFLIISSLGLFVSLGAMEGESAQKICDAFLKTIFCAEDMKYTIDPTDAFMIKNELIK